MCSWVIGHFAIISVPFQGKQFPSAISQLGINRTLNCTKGDIGQSSAHPIRYAAQCRSEGWLKCEWSRKSRPNFALFDPYVKITAGIGDIAEWESRFTFGLRRNLWYTFAGWVGEPGKSEVLQKLHISVLRAFIYVGQPNNQRQMVNWQLRESAADWCQCRLSTLRFRWRQDEMSQGTDHLRTSAETTELREAHLCVP